MVDGEADTDRTQGGCPREEQPGKEHVDSTSSPADITTLQEGAPESGDSVESDSPVPDVEDQESVTGGDDAGSELPGNTLDRANIHPTRDLPEMQVQDTKSKGKWSGCAGGSRR